MNQYINYGWLCRYQLNYVIQDNGNHAYSTGSKVAIFVLRQKTNLNIWFKENAKANGHFAASKSKVTYLKETCLTELANQDFLIILCKSSKMEFYTVFYRIFKLAYDYRIILNKKIIEI